MRAQALLVTSLLLITCAVSAQIYKWTDSQGVVNFSDIPHEGAEVINNLGEQSYPAPDSSSANAIPLPAQDKKGKKHVYEELSITQPTDDLTIRNNQGYLVVSAFVRPDLYVGDTVQVVLDQRPVGKPQTDLTFQLNGIYRGSHTVAVQIVSSKGNVLKTSPSVVVYMQRPRINMGKKNPN